MVKSKSKVNGVLRGEGVVLLSKFQDQSPNPFIVHNQSLLISHTIASLASNRIVFWKYFRVL